MIATALALVWLDGWLDSAPLPGWAAAAFPGQTNMPRGVLMLTFFLLVIWLAARELRRIFVAKGVEPSYKMMGISASIGLALIWAMPYGIDAQFALAVYATFGVGLFLLTLIVHARHRTTQGAVLAAAAVLMTMIYLGVLPGFYLAARRWHSAWVILAVILITKSCDIGAYFTGRALGRHKLIPWLSPGKTWEGLVGGIAFSGALAVLLVWLSNGRGVWHDNISGPVAIPVYYNLPLWGAALAGAALGLLGQLGDLTASLFKRDAGIKDSGNTIPGFGGVLDVMDSPIVVAPLAYWLLAAAAQSEWWTP